MTVRRHPVAHPVEIPRPSSDPCQMRRLDQVGGRHVPEFPSIVREPSAWCIEVVVPLDMAVEDKPLISVRIEYNTSSIHRRNVRRSLDPGRIGTIRGQLMLERA